jgi:trans-aconitate 2-methyltransferase
LNFVEADLIEWSTDEPVDLLFSNAALQWVPDHATLIERLARMVAPRGTFAAQMPINRYDPSHEAIRKVAADRRWASRLDGVGLDREWVQPATWYVERLHALGFGVNAWETTYVHVMRGEEPVLAWLRGTALRPIVAALEPAEASVFERCLAEELHRAYPPQGDLTLMPKARVFFVATRKSTESSQVRR